MNRLTLISAGLLIAIIIALIVSDKIGMNRSCGIFLMLLFPMIALGELASFAYDFAKRRKNVSGVPFTLRMTLHFFAFLAIVVYCLSIAAIPRFNMQ